MNTFDGTAELKPEELQVDICRHLAKENAELLENLYKSTITYFCSSWEEMRAVAAKLAGIILEHTDRQRMKWLDLDHLLMLGQTLQGPRDALLRDANTRRAIRII
ncbi:unnamed protein product [Caretta caretta]